MPPTAPRTARLPTRGADLNSITNWDWNPVVRFITDHNMRIVHYTEVEDERMMAGNAIGGVYVSFAEQVVGENGLVDFDTLAAARRY